MTLDAERAAHSGRQGDDWARSWSRATETRTFDLPSLVVQMWTVVDGVKGTLIASSVVAEQTGDVVAIDTTDCDFTGPAVTFAWKIAAADTETIAPGTGYVIEAQCEIDGDVTTFFPAFWWECISQFAVEQ